MKKGLLFLLGASLFGANTFAQDAEPDRVADENWLAKFDSSYSVYLDPTNRQAGIKDLTSDVTKDLWTAAKPANDVISVENGVLKIEHTRLDGNDFYGDVSLSTFDWRGAGVSKFKHIADSKGAKVDTLGGMYVDMTMDEDVTVSFTVKTDVDCQLRCDLVDANGRQGNGKLQADYQNTQREDLKADNGWKEVQLTWSYELFDYYSGAYWGETTGMWDGVGQVVNGTLDETAAFGAAGTYMWADSAGTIIKHEIKQEEVIPVDNRSIGKIMFIVDDAKKGTADVKITVEIKDLVIGSVSKAVSFEPFTEGATTLAYNPEDAYLVIARGDGPVIISTKNTVASSLVVYPNPAKGQITVNENVTVTTIGGVATSVKGEGVLDISTLPAGTYNVVGTTGTTTLIVE